MKRQFNLCLAGTLAIVLVTFAINGCKDTIIGDFPNPPTPSPPSHELVGTWFQQPLFGDESMERSLDFSDGFGTLIYPDRTGNCKGKPELLKRFSWEELVEGSQTLRLNIFRHEECGVARDQSYEEVISYTNHSTSLRIFDYNWMRKE